MSDDEYSIRKEKRLRMKHRICKLVDGLYNTLEVSPTLVKCLESENALYKTERRKIEEKRAENFEFRLFYSLNKHGRWKSITPESLFPETKPADVDYAVVEHAITTRRYGDCTAKSAHWLKEDGSVSHAIAKCTNTQEATLLANARCVKQKKKRRWSPNPVHDPNEKPLISYHLYTAPNQKHLFSIRNMWSYKYCRDFKCAAARYRDTHVAELRREFASEVALDEWQGVEGDEHFYDEWESEEEYKHETRANLEDLIVKPRLRNRDKKARRKSVRRNRTKGQSDFEMVTVDDCLPSSSDSMGSTAMLSDFEIPESPVSIVNSACHCCKSDAHWPIDCSQIEGWTKKLNNELALSIHLAKTENYFFRIACDCGQAIEMGDKEKEFIFCTFCHEMLKYGTVGQLKSKMEMLNSRRRLGIKIRNKKFFQLDDKKIEIIPKKIFIAKEFAELALNARKSRREHARVLQIRRNLHALGLKTAESRTVVDGMFEAYRTIEYCTGWLYVNRLNRGPLWRYTMKSVKQLNYPCKFMSTLQNFVNEFVVPIEVKEGRTYETINKELRRKIASVYSGIQMVMEQEDEHED